MKAYYTFEQVMTILEKYEQDRGEEISKKPFWEHGFECIYNFCKLSDGWVECIEDCCPYCVHNAVLYYGTVVDKELFNNNNKLGDGYKIPITRKEVAEHLKSKRKSRYTKIHKRVRKERLSKWSCRKDLEKFLRLLKGVGICCLRKNKHNVTYHLLGFCISGVGTVYVYDKRLPTTRLLWYTTCKDEEQMFRYIQEEYNKYKIPEPLSLCDIKLIYEK